MTILKTEKEVFSSEDVLEAIAMYEASRVPEMGNLWAYYEGNNPTILNKKRTDANNPDARIPIPYGRKIVTTYVGYAHRPRYITYKANVENDMSLEVEEVTEDEGMMEKRKSPEELYVEELQSTFNLNNEHIKTSRHGRNMAIFGTSYELLYIEGVREQTEGMPIKAESKFFVVDPREMILYYNYDSEPKPQLAIRYYRIDSNYYKVEVYYATTVVTYDRKREDSSAGEQKWILTQTGAYPNFYNEVPVVEFPFGDERQGVIRPVRALIDAMDVLISDSMNEFDRFSYAYLILKKFGLTDSIRSKDGGAAQANEKLQNLKKKRIIENIPEGADISFLTKDIPTGFIQFMQDKIREQIHVQSHVPDFTSDKMSGASGIAIQRLLFDFENVCSSAEADFDIGLLERIRLITKIYAMTGRPQGDSDMITISHKRNMPLNLMEFAQTAATMKQAGMSSYACVSIWPEDVIPDIQVELMRQRKEAEEMVGMSPLDQGEMLNQEEPLPEEILPEENVEEQNA